MGDARLKDATLLVLANKQDREGMTMEEVTIKMGLQSLKNRKWLIEGSCAVTGDGLHEGFQWLCGAVASEK
jgi:ADP-ribosylation factor 1/2